METNTLAEESVTSDYDFYTYDPTELCNRDSDNDFGAKFSTFYYLIFTLSLLGNGLVVYIIYKFEKLNTVTNIFLLNLVVSDLVFMSSLPFWGVYHQGSWIFGEAMCKIVGSAYFLGFYSSILFLTLMTFDRYLAVVHCLAASTLRQTRYAVVSSVAVWCISLLACIKPLLLFNVIHSDVQEQLCEEFGLSVPEWIDIMLLGQCWQYLQLVVFFLLPLVVIVYCYVRIALTVISSRVVTKFRTVRLIFFIVLLFFCCWTPYNVVEMLVPYADTCEKRKTLAYAGHVTHNVAYFYFCISPVFYTFVGRKFQNHFRKLLSRHMLFLKNHTSVNHASKSLSHKSPPTGGMTHNGGCTDAML